MLIANGVNLDLLGRRETSVYGNQSLLDLQAFLLQQLPRLVSLLDIKVEVALDFFQSNDEGKFLDRLSDQNWDGVVLNPGAWTHTSLALADRLIGLKLPFVEVHLSNCSAREPIRHHSFTAPHALAVVSGAHFDSYAMGLYGLLRYLLPTS